MIDLDVYNNEYIQDLANKIKADRNLVERALFAFGLLEALARVELPNVIKLR